MHKNHKIYKIDFAGKELVVETGKHAQLAGGACILRYGETVVLCTATAGSKPREGIDYFPLSIDYEEKMYAIGKIPGSVMRREARPPENAILTSRVIDRPMRPLFPKDLRNDVVIVCTVLSVEQDFQPEVVAMVGASLAVSISDIPFNGPVAAVAIGLVDGKVVLNPNKDEREKSDMYSIVSGTNKKICMIEAGAKEVDDDVMYNALLEGHEEVKKICNFIIDIQKEIGKEKLKYESSDIPKEIFNEIKEFATEDMKVAVLEKDKTNRDNNVSALSEKINAKFGEKFADKPGIIGECIYKLEKKVVRELLYNEGKRVDGRSMDDIRPLFAEVDVLPRTHGSGLFQRGQTQVLSNVTLSGLSDSQRIYGIDELVTEKRYMHHYNFPAYSVGDARSSRGPGRREIGHGALVEKALEPVIPSKEDFPYAIRVVSDVLMSNGSTSQGSICGSTLALMDAGVPITAPVAGISCGLITDPDGDEDKFVTFMDIQGIEDFFGDMDFKVAGTHKGITAIQVDIKTDGLTPAVIKEAFEITKRGRLQILDEVMLKAIDAPREKLSKYAPKIITTKVPVDKIKDVIGSGGKVINKIIEQTGVKIDINEDGTVFVLTLDYAAGEEAVNIIKGIVTDPEAGMIFKDAKVVKIMDFGAFVEFLPGKDGLVHISQLENRRVNKVEDVCAVGDLMDVKVIEIDRMGRIKLSRKALLEQPNRDNKE